MMQTGESANYLLSWCNNLTLTQTYSGKLVL